MRGVTAKLDADMSVADISTHTPHARRDDSHVESGYRRERFQLTRLMRGVTGSVAVSPPLRQFQLTRLMRGVTVDILLKS